MLDLHYDFQSFVVGCLLSHELDKLAVDTSRAAMQDRAKVEICYTFHNWDRFDSEEPTFIFDNPKSLKSPGARREKVSRLRSRL